MEVRKVKVKDIKEYEKNPRKNDAAVKDVMQSITDCGYCNPIIVDEDMVVLAGHTRLKAIKKLGWKDVDVCIRGGLTEEQKKKYRIYDNKTSEFAEWDLDKLADEIEGIDFEGYDIGFDLLKDTDFVVMKNTEYSDESFSDREFECECQECGFRFNKKR